MLCWSPLETLLLKRLLCWWSSQVAPTGEEAGEYFAKATGLSKADFDDLLAGLTKS
jgi:hypothetical protein